MTTKEWVITDEVKMLADQMADGVEETLEKFRKLTPLCPKHNLPGKFKKFDGSYTRVWAIYSCPKGHPFPL